MELLYREISPCDNLKEYVSSIWVQQTPVDNTIPSPTRVIPSGYSEMTFFYLNPIYEIDTKGVSFLLPRSSINGQKTSFKDYYSPEDIGTIIIRFRPGALCHFVPDTPRLFIDQNIDLKDVFAPSDIEELEERIFLAHTLRERIQHIERFLISCLSGQKKNTDEVFTFCLQKIRNAKNIVTIESLSSICELSRRSIEMKFRDFLGLTPKQYESIVRFQRVLDCNYDFTLADNFYDQSHFIRFAKKYTGQIPTLLSEQKSKTEIGKKFNDISPLYNTVYLDCNSLIKGNL